jgi:hypothetical protein
MRDRAAPGIGAEVLTLTLVLACLAGTFGIVLTLHRQAYDARRPKPATAPVVVQAPVPTEPKPAPVPAPRPRPKPAPPAPPPEDPTPKLVAAIAAVADAERAKADAAAAEAAKLAQDRREYEARQAKLKERTDLVRAQVALLDTRANTLEGALADLSHYRDVLAREREDAAAQLAEAKSKDGFAILPYKGPNGTWQRPIPIECRNGMAQIMPDGPRFSLLELSGVGRARSSPMVAAISIYLDRVARAPSPDGAPVSPYLLFIIRPDGIRPYYEARAVLEPHGIRFGYELVDQDEAIEYPNLADPAEWSEQAPLPFAKRWGQNAPDALVSAGGEGKDDPFLWVTPGGGGPGNGPAGEALDGLLADLIGPVGGEGGPGADPASGDALGGFGPLDAASPPGGQPGALAGRTGGTGTSPLAGERPGPTGMGGGTGLGTGGGTGLAGRDGVPGGRALAGAGGVPGGTGSSAGGAYGPARGTGTSPDGGPARGRMGAVPRDAAPDPGAVARALAAIEAGQANPLLDPRGAGLRPSAALSMGSDATGLMLAPGSEDGGASGGTSGGTAGTGGASGNDSLAAGASGEGTGQAGGGGTGSGSGVDGSRIRFRPRRTLDLVVACNAKGVTVHPGGYRLSKGVLGPEEARLVGTLRGLVERRQAREPESEIRPRLTFLVEPGGQETYWSIRKQTTYAGLDWPVHLRVAEGTTLAGDSGTLSAGDLLR